MTHAENWKSLGCWTGNGRGYVIEAGFPIASEGDFAAVTEIAKQGGEFRMIYPELARASSPISTAAGRR